MRVLLYSAAYSPRLKYIAHFIVEELLGIEVAIIHDIPSFKNSTDIKINYSNSTICADELHILPVDLLFENTITQQTITCFLSNNNKAFFKTGGADFEFDILAASFYLLSRYEEYLPHAKDMYGRYAHQNSLAFREGFLHLPLINIWVKDFITAIQKKFPAFIMQPSIFKFIPTYDIDIAYSYKHKGFIRSLGGFLKSPSAERIKVLMGLQKDPFDTYSWLDTLHENYTLKPLYFFLIAQQNGQYDKNILPNKNAFVQLIKQQAKKYTLGIHPSWQSGDDTQLLQTELHQLQSISGQAISISRQHYIRFDLPEGYQKLLAARITADYSMGYGSINGFRASVATAFYWYDLQKGEATTLRIHPFCFMEANSFYEQKLTAEEAFEELMQYYAVCKNIGGTLITIWHNNTVGSGKIYKGWGQMYQLFLENIVK